jgi:hypothetical protein
LRGCPEVLDGLDEREVLRVLEFVEFVGGALEETCQTVDLGRDEGVEESQRVDDGEERVAELPNRLEKVGRVLELVELKLVDFERALQCGAVRLKQSLDAEEFGRVLGEHERDLLAIEHAPTDLRFELGDVRSDGPEVRHVERCDELGLVPPTNLVERLRVQRRPVER